MVVHWNENKLIAKKDNLVLFFFLGFFICSFSEIFHVFIGILKHFDNNYQHIQISASAKQLNLVKVVTVIRLHDHV